MPYPRQRLSTPQPVPPRPAPLDTLALLPMLRVQAVEGVLESLAHAVAGNAIVAARWVADNWGTDADLNDYGHPARVAALDPESPAFKLSEAQVMLADACTQYRAVMGLDGLPVVRDLIERTYGATVADCALKPLDARSEDEWELEAMLTDTEHRPPDPTPAQRQAAAQAVTDWMLSDPEMADLAERLQKLLEAIRAAGGNPRGPAIATAWAGVPDSVNTILRCAAEHERPAVAKLVQITLDTWADTTGGPRITVMI
jgi:hypothetical protein